MTNGTNAYGTTYTFVAGGYGANSTTPLVSGITQGTGDSAMNFAYAYDTRGNITSETRNGKVTSYAYDALGQLIRVNDPNDTTSGNAGTTWVYEYDRGGNILNKKRYAYTTGTPGTVLDTIPYTYGDANWKDKLTAYDGQAITYDAIGNPLSDGTWTYQWQAGRQLKQMSKAGTTVQFKYDHNGLRTQKIVTENGVTKTTNYMLHGKLITHLTRGTDALHFYYDAQSKPAMVDFNGTMYTYVHNMQGDISSIVDNSGSIVVEYGYDAWGKKLSTTGTLATTLGALNPFRYRGYVYDEETGLYYLRSRYYQPTWGRFINKDPITYYNSNGLISNSFAYCKNCPTTFNDPSGKSAWNSIKNFVRKGVGIMIKVARSVMNGVETIQSTVNDVGNAAKKCCRMAYTSYHAELELRKNAEIAKREINSRYWIAAFGGESWVDWWIGKVNHDAEWDFKKNPPEWALTDEFYVGGRRVDMHEYGNIHYAFVGYYAGLSEELLIAGSAFAHYTFYGNWDDPQEDKDAIHFGVEYAQLYTESLEFD